MNKLKVLTFSLIFFSMSAMAAPASDASIKELLEITHVKRILNNITSQMDAMMSNSINQALQGNKPNKKQQQAIDKMQKNMAAAMKSELTWEKLEPMYIRLYKDSFTEKEVSGMLDFYKSPAGQAVINKMPVLMQHTMVEMRKIMSGLAPKMRDIQKEFIDDMQAAG